MRKLLVATIGGALLFATVGPGSADDVRGGICKVGEARISNLGQGMLKRKLWEYQETKLPVSPVMGWIDIGCADRGVPTSSTQDFGKRIWFNLAGPEGGQVKEGKLSVSDPEINTGVRGDAGISIEGLAIYGVITPQHDCIYEVSVWSDRCPVEH